MDIHGIWLICVKYFKNGYQPDGLGVTYQYQAVAPGSQVTLDDNLVLWFIKSR